ncbi:uncharacterized protein Z520_09475 [Fonsecaea multimorphosa CBS 102226]|uniref:BTB domain-containing protein n=1 Tax=Fonsecaea multimorphosa CBS 102226 TaxID=1442371 RepID=A0A0D2GZ16_9EURO|nr:uncharacterized protein Z520_09475 [Fonsecaea multimorphosa CBS 102226]KIX94785.1 hypothetical protein Z520_09475 [Fonsecaea multimorphosa CBS 102226]OAL20366.1 hypothetical protein AYO22_08860 [Fonsecaea multimorphosa]
MESNDDQTTHKTPNVLFDYSNVVTFAAGKGSNRQYFAFDELRLCRESTYFEERLRGDYPEGKARHFDFADVDPAVLACMLCWYRGWRCLSCETGGNHINETWLLAEKCRIPRLKEHLAKRMEARASATDTDGAQHDCPSWLCAEGQENVPATDAGPATSQPEIKDVTERDNRPYSLSAQEKKAF